MNRREMITMTGEEIDAYLASEDRLVLATLRADGHPHLTVMGYHYIEGTICMLSYERAQKILNLQRNPRCSCMVDTRGLYSQLKGVEAVGTAELVVDGDLVLDFARRHVAPSLFPDEASKTTPEQIAAKRTLLRIHIERFVSWDHSKLRGVY